MDENAKYGNFNSQTFTNVSDIDSFFRNFGFSGFVNWFNSNIKNTNPWKHDYLNNSTSYSINQENWSIFWNNIPLLFNRTSVNLIEFLCLNSIVINETGGSFLSKRESVNSSSNSIAPGIAYEFNGGGGKASYNTLTGNYTAYKCFHDPNYIKVNGTKGLASILKNTTDNRWQGTTFPTKFSGLSIEDETSSTGKANGFLIEADFFKFRGRGYIQLTSRPNYKPLVNFVLSYNGSDKSVLSIQSTWKKFGSNADTILTCSLNSEWDSLFLNKNYSLALWSVNNYLSTHYRKPLPINANQSPNGLQSSILNFGASVSGGGISDAYPKLFNERIIVQLNLINGYGPNSTPMAPVATENTQKQEQGVLERMGQDPNSQVSKPTTGNISGITNVFPPTAKPDPIKFYLQ